MDAKLFRILGFFLQRLLLSGVLLSLICCAGQAKSPAPNQFKGQIEGKTQERQNEGAKEQVSKSLKAVSSSKVKPQKLTPRAPNKGKNLRKSERALALVKKIISKYKKTSAIKMDVKKEVYIEMMEETKNSQGQLILSQGRLRLEIREPDKSLLIMNDNTIWIENILSEDFGGGVQVTKIAASKQLKRSNALIAFLFDDLEVWDKFKVVKRVDAKAISQITMKPLVQDDLADVAKIEISLNKKKSEISSISYWDQLENKTKFEFSKIDFSTKVTEKTFKYSPPKNAEVTTL